MRRNNRICSLVALMILICSSLNEKDGCMNTGNFDVRKNAAIGLCTRDNVLPKHDDYNYTFKSNYHFEVDPSDEFESVSACEGIHSEISSMDEKGNITDSKKESLRNDEIALFAFDDKREDNDSFSNATNMYHAGQDTAGIYKHSVWCQATISQKTSGWWLWETKYIDKDFYSFDVVSTGTLEVSLTNIPDYCDYDLRLYRLDDGVDADSNSLDFDHFLEKSSNLGSSERIVVSAIPGTYYACVYSYNDKTYDNDNPYTIKFEETVDTSRNGAYYDVNAGRINGDLGAVWVSDYKPLGYTPVTLKNANARVKITNYNSYPYIRALANTYNSKENYINYAVLYVWDVETKAAISALAGSLVKAVDEQTDWDSNKEKNH